MAKAVMDPVQESPVPGPSFGGTPSGGSHAASVQYLERRAWIGEYFDRTAAAAWKALTSDAPVSRVRATVRAGRDEMRRTLLGWLPGDLAGWRILDAGCGTGMLAVDLARRGAEVVAIDLSPTLVDQGRERAAAAGVSVDFRAGDMLDPALGAFDAMVGMDSLIHYDPPEILAALSALAPRVSREMLFTVAPRTPLLATLHAVGRLFPRKDRAPQIVPMAESRLRRGIAATPALAGWTLAATRRIERGFYRSQAYRLQYQGSTGAGRDGAGRQAGAP